MTPQINDTSLLKAYVGHLKHALATTTCRETCSVLEKMLSEAESRLQHAPSANASNPKML